MKSHLSSFFVAPDMSVQAAMKVIDLAAAQIALVIDEEQNQ